ncbi:putative Ig domain-containing protein [Dactylosporangium sp. NPDC000244]|uniref:putative Ig domain-containing protein n=1 Tax=Dactylosporangium sp. NPDC000244 TaxID=3154365 RepID=UPI00331FFFB5
MKLPRAGSVPHPRDGGFSLVETLTSIAIMGVVMTALTTFFVSTTNTINKERGLQMAIRLASDGIELVKSLPGSTLAVGRSAKDIATQLSTDVVPNLDLRSLATTMSMVSDPTLPAGASSLNPVLPVVPEQLTVNDAVFKRHWFIGSCVMDPKLGSGAPCLLSAGIPNPLSFFRVVVAITWQNSRACAGGQCSYITDTLVASSAVDPVFNPSVTVAPPLPDNPGNQGSDLNIAARPVQLTASSSYPPLTWSAEGLPPGITINDAGLMSGTPTAAGTYVVRVIVKDNASTNDASFNWVVNPLPKLVVPDQTFDAGSVVAFQVPLPGGTPKLAWTATGLPAGLTIDPLTGIVKGTTTASGAAAVANVTVGVTDSFGQKSSATFKWNTKVAVQYPNASTPIALTKDVAYSGSVVAAGGSGGYTFSSPNMPPGLSMSTAGLVTGKITSGTRFLVTVNVKDSNGVTNSTVVPVNVTVPSGLRITTPALTAPDKSSPKSTALTYTPVATGGTTPYTWTASAVTNLPTGLSLNTTTGAITGTPSAQGAWVVVLTVTDKTGATSSFAFTWTIT